MTTRAKFTVTEVSHYESGGAKIVLEPRFAPGKVFYADFTEAPEGTSKQHE